MLEIRSLSKSFGGVKATDNVTLDFADGSLTAVIGPNGAGKSTFFNLITGALRPDFGQILLNGVDMAGRSPPEIVRYGIGRAFQVASIFPSLTVEETMLAAVGADQRRASVLAIRSCSISRWRWCSIPRCCCSTSRPPAWAPKNAGG
jgi:branched-chain amino acid transport system ATP-binding protein